MKKEGRISIGWRTELNRGLPTKLGKDTGMNLIESWLMLAELWATNKIGERYESY